MWLDLIDEFRVDLHLYVAGGVFRLRARAVGVGVLYRQERVVPALLVESVGLGCWGNDSAFEADRPARWSTAAFGWEGGGGRRGGCPYGIRQTAWAASLREGW